jgi:transcriptional regulator with PAS, ATPase and Fis domain
MGRILQANGGTLFLDEIGDMPVALQARLLNVIEDREVMPLGGNKVVSVDVRVISATQHHPLDMIAKGQFREDLYYRLNGITVCLPPLRERTDVAELIRKLLNSEADGAPLEIEPALLERLVSHSWPGNVRQLRNVLRTMLALRTSARLTLQRRVARPRRRGGSARGDDSCPRGGRRERTDRGGTQRAATHARDVPVERQRRRSAAAHQPSHNLPQDSPTRTAAARPQPRGGPAAGRMSSAAEF